MLSIILCVQLCTTIVFAKEEVPAEETSEQTTEQTPQPTLVGELTEKRTANEKYFLYDDQTIVAAVYPTAVHYEDEKGAWQDIDNRLTEGAAEYENGTSLWKVKFAKKAKEGKLVKLKYGSHNIVWSLVDAQKTQASSLTAPKDEENPLNLSDVSSGIVYKDILEKTDLEYQLIGDQVKENLILKSANAPKYFTFVYETGHLEMSLENNTLFIKDGDNVVMSLDAPVMTDAALEESTDITLSLHEYKATAGNHMYAVTVTPDAKWLAAENRQYPVVVDPVLTTEQSHSAIEDTHAASSAPDQVRSDWTTTKVGMHGTSNVYRAFLKFDLPSALSVGDRVIDAQLALHPNTTSADLLTMASQKPVIQAHEITQSWNKDTLTWNNRPTCNEDTVIDYDMISGTTTDAVYRWYSWNITDLVDKWYTSGNNYGVMLKYNSETAYGNNMVTNFVSAETNITNAAFPFIQLRYANTLGLENHYTYHSVGVNHAGTAYINDFTGAMTLVIPIAAVASERAPINLSLVYTPGSNDTSVNKLNVGNDFMLNVQTYISPVKDNEGNVLRYKYVDGDGTAHYFSKVNEKWVDETGLGYELTVGSTYYTITTKEDSIMEFHTGSGRLHRTADHNKKNGQYVNYMELTYNDGYISSITNGTKTISIERYTQNNKQHIKFTYPDDSANGDSNKTRYALIVLTEYNNGIENIFQYVSVGSTATEQSRVGFKYSNRAITAVIDGTDMLAARFSYTTTNDNDPKTRRVSNYNFTTYEGGGQCGDENLLSYNITYGQHSTKYTSAIQTDRYELYTFDSLGRTITGQDQSGNAVFQELGFSGGEKNKVTFSSKTQRYVSNLVRNHNFEKNNYNDWYFHGASSDDFKIKGTAESEPTYMGNLGMKVYQHSSASTIRATTKQNVSLQGGKVYTLSAYVKTAFTKVASDSLAGACIAVERLSSPVAQKYRHAIISASGYTRHSVTIDLTGSAFSPNTSYDFCILLGTYKVAGAAYFDCVQLEEGSSVNTYNILENAGFEQSAISPWVAVNPDNMDGRVIETDRRHSGAIGYQIHGSPKKSKMLTQSLSINGQKGNAFTAGVWVKTNTVPHKDTAEDGTKQTCAITIEICHTDGSKQYESATIPTTSTQWRYVCVGDIAKENFSSVNIHLKYPYNCNVTYFDDACLFMDSFGQSYAYDGQNKGNLVSTIDLANNKTNITYTDHDEIASYTDAKNNTYTNTYKSNDPHLLATTKDPKNLVSTYSYNDYGQVTAVDGLSAGGMQTQTLQTYLDGGHFTNSTTDINHITTSQLVDENTGRVKKTYAPSSKEGDQRATNYSYDTLTKELTKVSVSTFNGIDYFHISPNVSYAYNRGNLTDIVRSSLDAKQMGYHYSYDGFGRVTSVKWSGKNTQQYPLSTTTYLNSGLVGSTTYGNGQTLSYSYNKANQKTATSYNGVQVEGYEYNANNALGYSWYLSDGNKIGTRYFYDLAGRINGSENDRGYTTDKYTYDLNNNLSSYHSALKDSQVDVDFTTHYEYNAQNAPTKLYLTLRNGYQSGEFRYGYDGLGRLNIKKAILAPDTGNGESALTTTITYKTYNVTDQNNTTVAKRTLQPSTTYITGTYGNNTVDTKYYTLFAPDGSLSRMRITENNVPNYTHYSYDTLGQLTTWKNTGSTASFSATPVSEYNYEYDGGGNITSVVHNESDTAKNYEATYTYDSNMSDLLTSFQKKDANGNPILTKTYSYTAPNDSLFVNPTSIVSTTGNTSQTWNLTWDRGRRLSSIQTSAGTINYEYNEDGLRTRRVFADGTKYEYHYNGTQLDYVKVNHSNGNMAHIFRYIYNSEGQAEYIMYIPAAYVNNPNVFSLYYIVRDCEGKIHKLIKVREPNSQKTGVQAVLKTAVTYTYDPYGKKLSATYADKEDYIARFNILLYKDYLYDEETGFYYLQSRYYDPEIGRFISPDTTDVLTATPMALTDKNLYAYCDNNPVVRADHSGEFWNYVIGGVVGAVVGGVSAAISGGDWKAIALGAGVGAVGGLLAASGVPAGFQIVAGGLLSGGNNLATQTLIEGKSLQEVDWLDVGIDTAIGAGTSALSYGVTRNASKAADKIICNGANKVVKGQQSLLSGSRYGKGAIKKGTAIMNSGIKQMNTVRGTSSVVGSTSGGFLTSVKSLFKRLFR